ncbi:MAG: zinc ribbon domain-containing protein [Candidatus Hodarchaeota archaeon]
MKCSKKISFILITILVLMPQIILVKAESTPDYVGVEENDVLIYRVSIDDDPYEDYLEDWGFSEEFIENITDDMFDDAWDEDVVGWRIVILQIKDEKEYEIAGDEYDGVPYLLNWYITEDPSLRDWEEEETNENGDIIEYSRDFYVYRTSVMMGLYYLIAANDINWKSVVNKLNDEYDDDWDGDDQKAKARVESRMRYFMSEDIGLSVVWNPDEEDYEDFESTSLYNDDGVLMYYEWTYDGETILSLQLEGIFFFFYGWIIVLGLGAGVVIIILLITLVVIPRKKKRKGEKVKVYAAPTEKKPEVVPPPSTTVPQRVNFCPSCGNKISGDARFCTKCGASLKF